MTAIAWVLAGAGVLVLVLVLLVAGCLKAAGDADRAAELYARLRK